MTRIIVISSTNLIPNLDLAFLVVYRDKPPGLPPALALAATKPALVLPFIISRSNLASEAKLLNIKVLKLLLRGKLDFV